MSEPIVDPTAVPPVAPQPVEPTPAPAPSQQLVSLTAADLQRLIADAVAAGAAQSAARGPVFSGQLIIPVEVPEVWTQAELMHRLIDAANLHNERLVRSAHATVDEHYGKPKAPAVDSTEDAVIVS